MDITVAVITAQSIAIAAAVIAIVRLHQRLDAIREDLDVHVEVGMHAGTEPRHDHGPHDHHDHAWPADVGAQVGQPLAVEVGPDGRWTVLVAWPDGTDDDVRDHLAASLYDAGYGVVQSLPDHDGLLPPSAVALVDPDGTVQGTGAIAKPADVLHFVQDGHDVGIAPHALAA